MHRMKERILDELPYLRRYASALTGDVDHGDELVRYCLQYAINLVQFIQEDTNVRNWLFSVMHKVTDDYFKEYDLDESVLDFSEDDLDFDDDVNLFDVRKVVLSLPLAEREAFLLVSLEGLDYASVQEILGLSTAGLVSLLDSARSSAVIQFLEETFAELRAVR